LSSHAEELYELVAARQANVLGLLLAALEDEDGGDASDTVLGGHARRLVDVELTDLDLPLELVRELLDDGRELTAGSAPRRREVDEHGDVGLENFGVEVLLVERVDVLARGH